MLLQPGSVNLKREGGGGRPKVAGTYIRHGLE